MLYSHSPTADLMKRRMSLQTEFNLQSTKQAEYLISKLRHTHYEHGEKASRILANQLRQRAANQTITAINDEKDLKRTDNEKMNSCFRKFYQALYTSEVSSNSASLEDFFKPLKIPSIDAGLVEELEKDFSVLEVASAISAMQTGKSPGPDGFQAEFFKKFSVQLSPLLLAVFKESSASNSLSQPCDRQ